MRTLGCLLALTVPALLLLAAVPAPAGAVVDPPVESGTLGPGESVLLGTSGASGVTIAYTTHVEDPTQTARLLRISCFFWCAPHEKDAAVVGKETLQPWEGGEVLYLIAPRASSVTYTATTFSQPVPLSVCPGTPVVDICG